MPSPETHEKFQREREVGYAEGAARRDATQRKRDAEDKAGHERNLKDAQRNLNTIADRSRIRSDGMGDALYDGAKHPLQQDLETDRRDHNKVYYR